MRRRTEARGGLPLIQFLGSTYAGHASRFADLRDRAGRRTDFRSRFQPVTGWRDGGWIERLALVPRGVRGRARATVEAAGLLAWPVPAATWTSCREEILPAAMLARGPASRPIVLDLDATDAQLEAWAPHYFGRPTRRGRRARLAARMEQLAFSRVSVFTPWSRWAADGLEAAGVPPERIRVIPPGVDLQDREPSGRSAGPGRPLRVLFVGGDFTRKGGDLLVRAAATLGDAVEVDLVTRDDVGALPPNVHTWRIERGDARFRHLRAGADLFVMPSRAECFGIATVEAMAAGLPVVVGDRGAAREIVGRDGAGFVIEPAVENLVGVLRALGDEPGRLAAMGHAARARAERCFDLDACANRVFDTVMDVAEWDPARERTGAAARADRGLS